MDKVLIKLNTHSVIDGEEEKSEFTTEGQMYLKGNSIYLKYQETEVTGLEGTDTTIKIGKDQVTIIRKGRLNSHLIFVKGQNRMSHYETPYGSVNVQVYTFSVNKKVDLENGTIQLEMKYQLSVNDSEEIVNTISLNSKRV